MLDSGAEPKDQDAIYFMPSNFLLNHKALSYSETEKYNLPALPTESSHFKLIFKENTFFSRVNYSLVAQTADVSENTLIYVLKQIMMASEATVAKDYRVKLNLRIGHLKMADGRFWFEPVKSSR